MGDTLAGLLTVGVVVLLLAATHAPLGAHLATVFTGQRHWRVERITYVRYRPAGAAAMLRRNLLVYGLGGIVTPFLGIKVIDLLVSLLPGFR